MQMAATVGTPTMVPEPNQSQASESGRFAEIAVE